MVWRPATMTRNYVLKATFFLSSLYFAQAQQGGEFQDMIVSATPFLNNFQSFHFVFVCIEVVVFMTIHIFS